MGKFADALDKLADQILKEDAMNERVSDKHSQDSANDAIDYGDAVEVVKWPCCGYKLGLKFIVNAMERSRSGFLKCVKCGARHESMLDALGPSADWNPVEWLKVIERTNDIPQGTRLG